MDTTIDNSQSRDRSVPMGMAAIGTVVLLVLCAVLAARLTGFEPAQPTLGSIVESRMLGFRDAGAGRVVVYDWDSGDEIYSLQAGEGSFLRGVMRSLVRQRRGTAIAEGAPFLLTRHESQQLVISDPSTGERIELIAFGPTNVALFAGLLPNGGTRTPGANLD